MSKVIIVGYGPAGISAAIYLKRAGLDPLVIGKDYGALSKYPKLLIENYYGFDKPISGNELIENGLKQAEYLGVDLVHDAVLSIDEDVAGGFVVVTQENTYKTEVVLLATGRDRVSVKIKNYQKFLGKGISLCAKCDGFFYRGKRLAVVGAGVFMKQELDYLNHLSDDILVFTNGKPLEVSVPNQVVLDPIVSFNGVSKVESISTGENNYDIDGIFIAVGLPSTTNFASKLGIITEKNDVVVDSTYQTNIPGLFAAGDVIGGPLQIAKAVYDGMQAAAEIHKFLKKK